MKFVEWEPIYLEILEDMGFSRERDEEAARLLSELVQGKSVDPSVLKERLEGKQVVVCGNAPSLLRDLEGLELGGWVVVAADGATSSLLRVGVVPDIIVTDLDGDVEDEILAAREGALLVVHAHGDNMDRLRVFVPRLSRLVATTQAEPLENVHNFGGFTDGDRAFHLAREFRAASIRLVGFDFNDPNVTPRKKRKLRWAERLIFGSR